MVLLSCALYNMFHNYAENPMICWLVAWAGTWQRLCKIGKNSPDQSSVTVGFTLERIQQTTGEL